ncbi:MAG: MlaE family ABC transporter permease [Thermodesulfobacteriota bacterium]
MSASTVAAKADGGVLTLSFSGSWAIGSVLPPFSSVEQAFSASPRPKRLAFETGGLAGWDSRFLIFCSRAAASARAAGMELDASGLPPGAVRLLNLAAKVPPRSGAAREKAREPFARRVGGATLALVSSVESGLDFLGEMTLSLGRLARGKAVFRSEDLVAQLRICGGDALPIVSLISMLVGLILAYVSAEQLKMFGAQIYTTTLVGIAMVRVLSAVMTAIIMAGRTGAAFAAELGTMQVNEEVDALRTFGVDPVDFLVLPRMLAMTIMMPLLCVYADFMGVMGGFIVGVGFLGLNPLQYIEFTRQTVPLANLWIGLLHAFVFGILVSLAGCYQGMRCGRSAMAVGQATTSAVVTSIVSVIVATSILTVLFNVLGI